MIEEDIEYLITNLHKYKDDMESYIFLYKTKENGTMGCIKSENMKNPIELLGIINYAKIVHEEKFKKTLTLSSPKKHLTIVKKDEEE